MDPNKTERHTDATCLHSKDLLLPAGQNCWSSPHVLSSSSEHTEALGPGSPTGQAVARPSSGKVKVSTSDRFGSRPTTIQRNLPQNSLILFPIACECRGCRVPEAGNPHLSTEPGHLTGKYTLWCRALRVTGYEVSLLQRIHLGWAFWGHPQVPSRCQSCITSCYKGCPG